MLIFMFLIKENGLEYILKEKCYAMQYTVFYNLLNLNIIYIVFMYASLMNSID